MTSKYNIKTIIALIGFLLLGVAGGWTVTYTLTPPKTETKVETEVVDTNAEIVETGEETVELELNGETEEVEVKVVEEVNGVETPTDLDGKSEEEINLGRGEYYDTTTPQAFFAATNGKCIDMDGWYGAQCVDYFAAFNYQENGYWIDTCGTGAARGIWDCKIKNAKDNYQLIEDPAKLQPGDWIIFNGGTYGHVGMAMGYYDNGYILLAGENQGGAACNGGGAAVNLIKMNLSTFRGAFRPNKWVVPEPVDIPAEDVNGTVNYVYIPGDYFSGVIVRLGLATEHGLWGPDGDVAYYNQQLLAQGLVMDDHGRIYGNIPVGSEIRLERRQ